MMEQEMKNAEPRDFGYLADNLAHIREEIRKAEALAGAPAGRTLLLAAVKSADADEINHLTQTLGVTDIGENRVQQLMSRYDLIAHEGVRIHFIGSLQKNKVKYIIDKVAAIHSVDSLSLAQEIDKRARLINRCMDIFVEINSGREENKGGVMPECAAELCLEIAKLENVRVVGLMTMAAHDTESYRASFALTRTLAETVFRDVLHREDAPLLSMGMSESYREAIAEGADIVRVGRQLFSRPTADETGKS